QTIGADSSVCPADDCIAPKQRHGVVTADALGGRRIGFEAIGPSPEMFESFSIPYHRIKWCKKPDSTWRVCCKSLRRRQQVMDSIHRLTFELAPLEKFTHDWPNASEVSESCGI